MNKQSVRILSDKAYAKLVDDLGPKAQFAEVQFEFLDGTLKVEGIFTNHHKHPHLGSIVILQQSAVEWVLSADTAPYPAKPQNWFKRLLCGCK